MDSSLSDIKGTLGQLIQNNTSVTNEIIGGPGVPTALVKLTATTGVKKTWIRSDGAPALDQTIDPTWTGMHFFAPSDDETGVTILRNDSQTEDMFQIRAKESQPDSIDGLVSWYAFDELGGSDGDPVSAFPDKMGNHPMTLSAVGAVTVQVAERNGLNVIQFPNGSGFAESTNTPTQIAGANRITDFEMFFMCRWEGSDEDSTICSTDLSGNEQDVNFTPSHGATSPAAGYAYGQIGEATGNSNETALATTQAGTNVWAIHNITREDKETGPALTYYLNGTDVTNGVKSVDGSIYWGWAIAGRGTNSASPFKVYEHSYTGSIGEILVYNRQLTATERTAVTNYLQRKWGFSDDYTRYFTVDNNGLTGIGGIDPANLLHMRSSTTPQRRSDYDADNYMTEAVLSDGEVQFDAVGTDPEFTFLDAVNFSGGANVTSPFRVEDSSDPANQYWELSVAADGAATANAVGTDAEHIWQVDGNNVGLVDAEGRWSFGLNVTQPFTNAVLGFAQNNQASPAGAEIFEGISVEIKSDNAAAYANAFTGIGATVQMDTVGGVTGGIAGVTGAIGCDAATVTPNTKAFALRGRLGANTASVGHSTSIDEAVAKANTVQGTDWQIVAGVGVDYYRYSGAGGGPTNQPPVVTASYFPIPGVSGTGAGSIQSGVYIEAPTDVKTQTPESGIGIYVQYPARGTNKSHARFVPTDISGYSGGVVGDLIFHDGSGNPPPGMHEYDGTYLLKLYNENDFYDYGMPVICRGKDATTVTWEFVSRTDDITSPSPVPTVSYEFDTDGTASSHHTVWKAANSEIARMTRIGGMVLQSGLEANGNLTVTGTADLQGNVDVGGNLSVDGGLTTSTRVLTSSDNMAATDFLVIIDTISGAVTYTLDAVPSADRMVVIKRRDAGVANAGQIDPNGNTIEDQENNETTAAFTIQPKESLWYQWDATYSIWRII